MHCLNFNAQRQKRHDFTNDVNVNFLILMVVRCKKNMLLLSNILFIILNICAMEFAEKLTLVHFCLEFAWS